ncbi:Alpha/Beta hydrolase protein [Truncatella angustata]|uniref:Alpha/Beta hydrolase protein n=1 Tax=Truncatella angustata TaxID=152316 RepID=A0A9P8UU93_9PEZI|nr:Alpha/Beta hydrolase protein [Truncatella angustata]KAH6658314.1 Alpha/Beta hydrolase protein [Truncatella angustata]
MAAAVEETSATGASPSEEIKPYQIHVSSRYLNLTKEKLEITRLPHELSSPRSEDWWEPKPQIEPLIDFWLEEYSWRSHEAELNAQLPQFRTGFSIPQSEAPIRLHFIHICSTHSNALPLLMIPPFPFTNLSFGHIIKAFTDPEDVATNQPFHLVIPSLPGLGFSDALPNNTPVISTSGDMLDSLMARLNYPRYLATNMGSGSGSPAEIDWQLANYLAIHHLDSCLGVHFISPPLAQPKLQEAPLEWAKWSLASLLKLPMLGYLKEDFSALERSRPSTKAKATAMSAQFGLNQLGLREPNTLAYALCDSPTGLLVFALKSLRLLGPKREFTQTELITFTQLAWLPGPEAAMRFWAYCLQHPETCILPKKAVSRPKIAITVFLGDEPDVAEVQPAHQVGDAEAQPQKQVQPEGKDGYACPSWANAKYHVVHAHRASGKSGLLAWERPELVLAGVQGLAREVLRLDSRLQPSAVPETVPLQQVVAGTSGAAEHANDAGPTTGSTEAASSIPETRLQPPTPGPGALTDALLAPIPEERGQPHREISEETRVASDAEEQEAHLKAKSDDTLAGTSPHVKPLDSPSHVS